MNASLLVKIVQTKESIASSFIIGNFQALFCSFLFKYFEMILFTLLLERVSMGKAGLKG